MNNQTVFRRLIRAYIRTIIVFASVHLGILFWHAVRSGDYAVLLAGDVLDLGYVHPALAESVIVEILAAGVVCAVFVRFFMKSSGNSVPHT